MTATPAPTAAAHPLDFDRGARLLVVAPHPDDETLACGGLILHALAAGAAVRVLFATDGDNNPWPQRWLERRLWIDAAARRRWGERRRAEATAALAELGAGAVEMRWLGWPDQGLTRRLVTDDDGVATLAAELAAFAPTHLVGPALSDRHPDHSALHLLLALARLRAPRTCCFLTYAVHGVPLATQVVLPVTSAMLQRKLAALACYHSQLSLSRGRLLAIARRPERFDVGVTEVRPVVDALPASVLQARVGPLPWPRARHDLLVVAAAADGTARRACVRLATSRAGAIDVAGLELRLRGEVIEIAPDAGTAALVTAWAKWHRREPRLVVFDRLFWHAATPS